MGGRDGVEMPRGKVGIVGDGAIGKTFLLTSLLQEPGISNDWDNPTYQPTAATNLSACWEYTDAEGRMHGVWLKSMICELRAKSLANKEVPVVKKAPGATAPEAGCLGGAKMSEWV